MSESHPHGDLDPPRNDAPRQRLRQLSRLLGMIRPYRVRFYLASVALLAGSAASLLYPQAVRWAVDSTQTHLRLGHATKAIAELNRLGALVVVVALVQVAFIWVRHYLMSWLGERVVADLRCRVFERLVTLPPAWFHARRSGEIVGRLASDVTAVEMVIGSQLSMALRNAVTLVGALMLLSVQNPGLTLAMLAIVPPLMISMVFFGRFIRRLSRDVQDRLASVSGHLEELVSAMETVQAFVREAHESRAYGRGVEQAFGSSLRLIRWRASFMASSTLTFFLGLGFIIWLGSRQVIANQMSPGELLSFLMYTVTVAAAVGTMTGVWSSLQRAAGSTERIFEIIDTEPAICDPITPRALPAGAGEARFVGVGFSYAGRPEVSVLRRINLDIPQGATVALVGHSGAGKTTLASLLPRFEDPSEGTVFFEGVDLRQLRLAELRRAMAVVSQEPVLFSGTIRDNIAYGREDANGEDIVAAARAAYVHDFATALPAGYDTLVGERGVKLSGGQKQRVAIARALLANPRLLILDEATSNLDADSELMVQDALSHLMRGRTTVVIAHRLSTVREADCIVVLSHGEIVAQGKHEELMRAGGVYRRLVEHQIIADPSPAPVGMPMP